MQYPGKIIVIEGIDGAGKSTQTKLLIQRCRSEGIKTFSIHFPQHGESVFGNLIDEYLRGEFGDVASLNPYLISTLYAGDRFEAKAKLEDALAKNHLVILDRYLTSNIAYQRSKLDTLEERRSYLTWLRNLEHQIFQIPQEDLVIFLDLPPEESQRLMNMKDLRSYTNGVVLDQIEQNSDFLKRSYRSYVEAINEENHWKKVSCLEYGTTGLLRSIDEIHEDVWQLVSDFIKRYPELRARW